MACKRAPDAVALTQLTQDPTNWLPEHCPIAATLSILSGKWKPSILYVLCRGPTRFNALQRALPGITQRILTLQLRALERDGLVQRTIEPSVPPQVEYALTALGYTLGPVMEALAMWGKSARIASTSVAKQSNSIQQTSRR